MGKVGFRVSEEGKNIWNLGKISLSLIFFVVFTALTQVAVESIVPKLNTPLVPLLLAILASGFLTGWNKNFLAAVSLIITSLLLSGVFNDVYFDGITYHQSGIFWVAESFSLLFPDVNDYWVLFVNFYPKLSWLYGSAFLGPVSFLGLSKSINFIFLFASLCLAMHVAAGSLRFRMLIAAAVAMNPIAVSQVYSNYVDGLVAQGITLATLALYAMVRKSDTVEHRWIFIFALLVLPSLKFTGLLFSAIYLVAALTLYYTRRFSPALETWAQQLKTQIQLGVFAFFSLVLLSNPYLSNVIGGHHPLHPAFGSNKLSTLISGQTTPEYYSLPPAVRLFQSVLSKSMDLGPWSDVKLPSLKIPFTLSPEEIYQFAAVDTRAGGWGPLFSGLAVLGLIIFVILCFRRQLNFGEVVIIISLVSTVLLNPESWWARYSPQLALLPAFLFFISASKNQLNSLKSSKLLRASSVVAATVSLLNSLLVMVPMLANVNSANNYINLQIQNLVDNSPSRSVIWDKRTINLEAFFAANSVSWYPKNATVPLDVPCIDLYGETVCANPR